MTTPPKLPPSRWPRFIPKRFTIGALLVLITIVACFLGWYVQPPKGTISQHDVSKVKFGQMRREVHELLGEPAIAFECQSLPPIFIDYYRIRSGLQERGTLVVQFKKRLDTVETVQVTPKTLKDLFP